MTDVSIWISGIVVGLAFVAFVGWSFWMDSRPMPVRIRTDAEKIADDWRAVGDDMRRALGLCPHDRRSGSCSICNPDPCC